MSQAEGGTSPWDALYRQLSALTQAVTHLQEGQQHMEERLATLSATVTHAGDAGAPAVGAAQPEPLRALPSMPPPEPRVAMPERFSGDRRRFRSFRSACLLYFALQPRTFAADSTQVRFIISLLSEEPQTWAHRLLELNGPEVATTSAFFSAMADLYDDPMRTSTAESSLQYLRQGRRPVEEYVAEFRRWMADVDWNDSALRHQFRVGLSESLKDELARSPLPATLNDLILSAIQLDRRLRERRAERSYAAPPVWVTPRVPYARTPPAPPTPPSPDEEPEPMQIGLVRPPVSPEENLRRRQRNLCFYCGGGGHVIRDCPVRPGKRGTNTPSRCPVFTTLSNHLAVSLLLQVEEEHIPLRAIIDSGACSCFLDSSWATRFQLPTVPKEHPLQVQLADGSTPRSGPVSRETLPILATIGGGHQERIRFDLISSPLFPVILGLPWLQAHNPQIDWSTRQVQFTSSYCRDHCLPPGPLQEAPFLCMQAERKVPDNIPSAYHDFLDVFDEQGADHLPPHRPYDCPIELLPGAKIPYGRIFPLTEPELEALRLYINESLKKGFIRPSSSPAGAGIFFVEKKDHTLRPCVDYRELNNITVKNRYPLPLVPELFQRLRSARVFTKIDLRGAYNLVRIRRGDEWKTAFRTRFGHFEYLVMPFGLCNAPATFQYLINDVLREYLDLFVIAYLDDILIFSDSLTEHRVHVTKVLSTLRQHRLYAKAEKCQFEAQSIHFLGLIISTQGLTMDPQKISAILEWPSPSDKKGVQRFIGFANFYRRFIRGFSEIVTPITNLTRLSTHFSWTPEAQEAFDKLKGLFTTAPLLRHPEPDLPYVLEVDASETALGAVLSQRQGPKSLLHPVAFFSRKLSVPERNYDVGDRELLAIKAALEEWRYLLEGAKHPILTFTDHKNLEYLRSARRLKPRQARWALFFSRFRMHITYRPGSKNGKADALSRMFPEPPGTTDPDTILPAQNFLLLQADFRSALQQASGPDVEAQSLQLNPRDGLLWAQDRIFVPAQLRTQALHMCHDNPLAGHFGGHKTTELLQRSFWWPKLAEDARSYVKTCPTCARSKGDKTRAWGLLRPLPIPDRPWGAISMDFIVELPPSESQTTIFVTIDRLTKMAHFIPMKGTPSAQETAQTFIKEIVRLHGIPDSIVSDRGTQFTSKFWRELCKALNIQSCRSSAYHPQSNGQTERTNQTLEQYLRCYTSSSQGNWAALLPLAEFAYNNTIHSSTQQTPFWANYGTHPVFLPGITPETPVPAVQERIVTLRANHLALRETLKKAQAGQKRAADKRRRGDPDLKPGDSVWLSSRNLKLRCPAAKLGPKFIGPFQVKRRVNPVAFELVLPGSLKIHPVFHSSLLKPALPDPFPARSLPPPPPVEVAGDVEFEVEEILDCRRKRGQLQYLVAWKGYGTEENSWEPAGHIHAPNLLNRFRSLHPEKWATMGIRRLPLGGGHCHGTSSRGRRTSRGAAGRVHVHGNVHGRGSAHGSGAPPLPRPTGAI